MKRRNESHPGLAHLLCAYFHEDCFVDDADADGVVRRFAKSEPARIVDRAREDLARVLEEPGADLEELLVELGCHYLPSADGLTARTWLAHVRELLAKAR